MTKPGVILIRSHDPFVDSRFQKYIAVLNKYGINYTIICWARTKKEIITTNCYVFSINSKPGAGIKNAMKLFVFNIWVAIRLLRHNRNYDTIHAIDLDTILPAFLVAKILKKKILYDIYDLYGPSRNISGWFGRMLDSIERGCAGAADYCILPSANRAEQLAVAGRSNVLILENVPMSLEVGGESISVFQDGEYSLVFSYVGVLQRKHRGIEHILRFFLEHPQFGLLVAGYGELSPEVRSAADNTKNIKFFGEVSPSTAVAIMAASDVIFGIYHMSLPAHAYASPNKYYEHLMLGKALVTSKNTPPGKLVEEFATGIAIYDEYQDLARALVAIGRENLEMWSRNAACLWSKRYADYYEKEFVPAYLNVIGRRQLGYDDTIAS